MMLYRYHSFLLKLSRVLGDNKSNGVSETVLQEVMKLTYKEIHQLASYWVSKGCVKSHTLRGGVTHYNLTSLGEIEVQVVKKLRRKWVTGVSVSIIMLILCGLFLGY